MLVIIEASTVHALPAIEGLMVSMRWCLGFLKGQLEVSGSENHIPLMDCGARSLNKRYLMDDP